MEGDNIDNIASKNVPTSSSNSQFSRKRWAWRSSIILLESEIGSTYYSEVILLMNYFDLKRRLIFKKKSHYTLKIISVDCN